MDSEDAKRIVNRLREIVTPRYDAAEKSMYGGIVFELDYLIPKRLFCGFFARRDYVTVEFDRGSEMEDPRRLLEGGGTHRRHLRLYRESDIEAKDVAGFIEQSYMLPS